MCYLPFISSFTECRHRMSKQNRFTIKLMQRLIVTLNNVSIGRSNWRRRAYFAVSELFRYRALFPQRPYRLCVDFLRKASPILCKNPTIYLVRGSGRKDQFHQLFATGSILITWPSRVAAYMCPSLPSAPLPRHRNLLSPPQRMYSGWLDQIW